MMRVLVNGAGGRMGGNVLRLVQDHCRDSQLAAAVDAAARGGELLPSLNAYHGGADVIVDFSHHTATAELLNYAVAENIPLVIGTTGQDADELALIHAAAEKIPVFLSANMSMGVALLSELAVQTARAFPEADIEIVETHHRNKVDAPSGTALLLARAIQTVRENAVIHRGRDGMAKREPGEIGIHAVRRGSIVGTHEVIVSTDTQTITLKHEAHDRFLFAEGALAAAEFMVGKPAGFYSMQDLITKRSV